jgi:hypothetical protein
VWRRVVGPERTVLEPVEAHEAGVIPPQLFIAARPESSVRPHCVHDSAVTVCLLVANGTEHTHPQTVSNAAVIVQPRLRDSRLFCYLETFL